MRTIRLDSDEFPAVLDSHNTSQRDKTVPGSCFVVRRRHNLFLERTWCGRRVSKLGRGVLGNNRRERGTGGETGRRGVSLSSLHESHSEGDSERGYVSSKKHTHCHFQYLVSLRCGESETEVNEVNSSESSRFALMHFR